MSKSKFWLFFLFLAVYVGMYALIANYAHPSSDDYAHFVSFKDHGFWGAQIQMWSSWSSRFTVFFIINLGYLLGVMGHYSLHVYTWIIFSIFSIYFLISTITPETSKSIKLLLTLLFQSLWFSTAVGLNETLYWYSGAPYYYTVAFIIFEIAFIIKIMSDTRANFYFILCALSIFLNSGISELSAAYQLPMLLAAVIICMISGADKNQALKYIFILLCVAMLGFIVQLLNPGNNARASVVIGEGAKNISTFIKSTFFFGPLNALTFFLNSLIYVVLLFYPTIVSNVKQPGFIRELPFNFRLWHIFMFQFLTSLGFSAIGGYTGGGLPPRAVGTVIWIMLIQWILFFAFCYRNDNYFRFIGQSFIYRYRFLVLVMCLIFSGNFIMVLEDYKIAPAYSSYMATRNEYIIEQKKLGNLDIVYPVFENMPSLLSLEYRGNIVDSFILNFYKINSFRSVPKEIMPIALKGDIDINEELSELHSLAEKGNVLAQVNLAQIYGTSYEKVKTVEKNDAESVKWLTMAAKQGHRHSKRRLTGVLGLGLGTPDGKPDIIGAAKWYLLSMM